MNPYSSSPVYDQPGSRLIQLGVSRRSDSHGRARQLSAGRPRSRTTCSTPDPVSRRLTARPAWPAPRTATGTVLIRGSREGPGGRPAGAGRPPTGGSGSGDVDADVGAVGQDVEDRRPATGLLDQLGELLGGGVALDGEVHPDLRVAVPDAGVQAEDAEQVDVALDAGLHPGQVDAAGRGDV